MVELLDELQELHCLIVGAGPSGLAAGLTLVRKCIPTVILERAGRVGGLMQSLRRCDFTVDVGRKELYTRIPEVDQLWNAILGTEYREYTRRVGSLYRGRILEMSGNHRGLRRGLPLPWFVQGGIDLARSWVQSSAFGARPATYEEYFHQRAGPKFARIFAQGYWEKFRGIPWSDLPPPDGDVQGDADSYSLSVIRDGLQLASQGGPTSQKVWRHPAKGTGQICDLMLEEFLDRKGEIRFNAEVTAISAEDAAVREVTVSQGGKESRMRPRHLVSSMQIEQLTACLRPARGDRVAPVAPVQEKERSVLLVYLFLDEPSRFPHAWLEVNDADLNCGRITNYAAFNGDMVPAGKSCLCVEFFCTGDGPLTRLSEPELCRLAVKELAANRLIDEQRIFDTMVLSLRRSNAAASWRDWQSDTKLRLLDRIKPFANLYHVNRPGTDWATFAGMLAGDAIAAGDRQEFDRRVDPTRRYSSIGPDPVLPDGRDREAHQTL